MNSHFVLACLCLVTGLVHGGNGTISNDERAFVINYLNASFLETQKVMATIDDSLWNYKPKDGGWSIAECMEHIMLAENAVFFQAKKTLQAPADATKSLKHKDGLCVSFITDRGKKAITPLPPKEVTRSRQEYLAALKSSRDGIESFLQDNTLELRNHFGKAPWGEVDTYQLFLVIAGHGLRHTAQMKAIIAEYTGEPVAY